MVLRLFIAGRTVRSERAIAQARRICRGEYSEPCELLIVDVLQEPEAAERARILATPTLIKDSPPPARRVIGDLGDMDQVLSALGLNPACAPSRSGGVK